ncbi:MAG: amidohydrolase family protein [Roseiflexus sp.]|nr:amidohydrolase family protein [Roseiflexus sp.]
MHFQPPEALAYLADAAEREPYWAMLLGLHSTTRQSLASADEGRVLADMDRAEIDRAVIQGEYYRQHESCVAANNRALALHRRYPERFLVFATVQPADARALDEARRCAACGAVGIGELNPYAQGFTLDSPAFLRLAETCIDLDLPLLLHVNEPVGRYYPGKAVTPLAQYYALALRFPDLKIILAHWGGGLFFYELMPSVRQALRNVWYDTAASPLLYPTADIFAVALRCVHPRKILFGSDYPLPLYPRVSREPDFAAFLDEITALDITPDIRDDILGRNSARLLGLIRAEEALAPEFLPRPDPLPPPRHPITAAMSVAAIATAWSSTRTVLEAYGIPWETVEVPFWEPLSQAAAARGIGPDRLARLLADLNAAVQHESETP